MEPDPINPLKSMIQHQLFQLGIGYTTPVGAYQNSIESKIVFTHKHGYYHSVSKTQRFKLNRLTQPNTCN